MSASIVLDDFKEICSICLESLNNKYIYTTKCNHIYHRQCIEIYCSYINNNIYGTIRCPLCNENITLHKKFCIDSHLKILKYIMHIFLIILITLIIIYYI